MTTSHAEWLEQSHERQLEEMGRRFRVLQSQHHECLRVIAELQARVVKLTPKAAAFDAVADELANRTEGKRQCCLECHRVVNGDEIADERRGLCRECAGEASDAD